MSVIAVLISSSEIFCTIVDNAEYVQSSSRLFPPANVRPQVDETVRKILLKSTDSQVFSGITTGHQKSVSYGEATATYES